MVLNKKDYTSPDLKLITFGLEEVLVNSPLYPPDPQIPTRAGDKGLDGDI